MAAGRRRGRRKKEVDEFERAYNRPGGLRIDKAGNPRPFIRYSSNDGTSFDILLDEDGNPMPGQGKPEPDRELGWVQSIRDVYGDG